MPHVRALFYRLRRSLDVMLTNVYDISNGRHTVGDGAFTTDAAPSVLAVCHMQGADDMYYYSTTFSGGPQVACPFSPTSRHFIHSYSVTVAVLTSLSQNALLTAEGRCNV